MKLYMIQEGQDGNVKVGLAKHVQARLAGLQTSNPRELRTLCEVEIGNSSARVKERAVHEALTASGYHVRGEWFAADCVEMATGLLRDLELSQQKESAKPSAFDVMSDEHMALQCSMVATPDAVLAGVLRRLVGALMRFDEGGLAAIPTRALVASLAAPFAKVLHEPHMEADAYVSRWASGDSDFASEVLARDARRA